MSDFLKNVPKGSEGDDVKNPLKDAQRLMQPELPKRFYDQVSVTENDSGFTVLLDNRPIKTPGKITVTVPNQDLADLMAGEWDEQTSQIDPSTMPITKLVNTALEGVAQSLNAVIEDIVSFAGTDLLCYRADNPPELVASQSRHWDPVIEWMRDRHGANFVLVQGIMHTAQPEDALEAVRRLLSADPDPLKITSLHNFTSLTGSALLALALSERFMELDEVWAAAHVDEDYNISKWGEDYEATARRKKRYMEMTAAWQVFETMIRSKA